MFRPSPVFETRTTNLSTICETEGQYSIPVGVHSPVARQAIDQLVAIGEQITFCGFGVDSMGIHSPTDCKAINESSMAGDRFTSHDGGSSKNQDHCYSTINYLMVMTGITDC